MASSTAAVNAATRPSCSRRKYGIATIAVPISAGASRAVKSVSPNSAYMLAVR